MINTIGKKTHTLVKENTPHCQKIRQECVSLKRSHFSLYYCVFFPTAMQILVGRLDSYIYLLTHTKKYMTPTHALIFKNISIYVFVLDILKSHCKLITLWGVRAAKNVGWEVIFSELGFAGSGARKPRKEFEGNALEPFFYVVLRLNGL